jgi:hypothetical protein
MCYDAKTSIGTFGFVAFISLYLWQRNNSLDRAISLILLVVVAMQLLEFIIWTHLGETTENRIASVLIPVLLYLQPLLIALIMWIFKAGWYTESYKLIVYALVLCLPILSIVFYNMMKEAQYTMPGPNGHLMWAYPNKMTLDILALLIIYYGLLAYLFMTLKNPILSVSFLAGYTLSWFYYKIYYGKEFGSLWCHSVNGIALLSLFIT